MAGKIKSQKYENSQNLRAMSNEKEHPAFSFKYIVNNQNYNLDSSKADVHLRSSLLNSLHKYSKIPWDNFIGDKKRTGVEIVGLDSLRKLKVSLPNEYFYNNIKKIIIFRISDKARLIGYRYSSICYVLWIDWDLSSYDHGS